METKTIDALIELKADGYKSLYYLDVKGLVEVIFRPLTFEEYETVEDLENYLDSAAINDTIVKMSTLYSSKDLSIISWVNNFKYAFYIDHMAQAILDISGFRNQEKFLEILKEKRQVASEVQSLIELYICTAFKTLLPSKLKELNLYQQIELFAKAESMLGKPVDFDAIFDTIEGEGRDKAYPVPDGMESTNDILSEEAVTKLPQW